MKDCPSNASKDRGAILELIERETLAYHAKDFEEWAACWLQSDKTLDMYAGPLGTIVRRGWIDIATAMHRIMQEDPEPSKLPFRQNNFHLHVDGDLAWATFDGYCQVSGDEEFLAPDSHETRVLERHDGQWLIAVSNVLALRSLHAETTLVQVNRKGQILWAANETMEALRRHPSLTVSAGRVRAKRPNWDKHLQGAFDKASKLHHLFQFERGAVQTDQLVFPVILGEDDAGGVQSCLVHVRDAATYLSFDDGKEISRRTRISFTVFGLSDAQSRLAKLIVAGLGLTAAADELGISLNTARTHLTRIYDKTGVNSQSALVRVLLSAGAMPV